MSDNSTLAFFTAHTKAFSETLANFQGRDEMLEALMSQAYSSFAGNVELAARECPELACHKGCATCCTLRVTATAPEILLIVCFVYARTRQSSNLDLFKRVEKANRITCGLNEMQRVALKCPCPFLDRGVCSIYPVRPLACRGHACYDKKACIDAAAGRLQHLPVSEPFRDVRCIIQSALQSALRDGGYPWVSYELIQGVAMVMQDATHIRAWLRGEDVLALARVEDISLVEMTETLDAIKAITV